MENKCACANCKQPCKAPDKKTWEEYEYNFPELKGIDVETVVICDDCYNLLEDE